MLSLGEFTERMDTVLAAKTRGDLNQVLIDLPGIVLDPAHGPSTYPAPTAPGYPVVPTNGTPLVLKGRMSTLQRKGHWDVPPVVRIDTWMSSVSLDFTDAVARTQVVHIEVDDHLSSIGIVVPDGVTADIDGLENIGSSSSSKVGKGTPHGPLHLVVTGKLRFGSLTIAHPFGTRMKKFLGGS